MRIRQEAIAEVQARETEREKNNCEGKRLGEKIALKAMMKVMFHLDSSYLGLFLLNRNYCPVLSIALCRTNLHKLYLVTSQEFLFNF